MVILAERLPALWNDIIFPILPELARGGGPSEGRWRGSILFEVEHL
jgi:hypothetical protein